MMLMIEALRKVIKRKHYCLIIAAVFEHCAKLFATEASGKKLRGSINLSGASLNDETFFDVQGYATSRPELFFMFTDAPGSARHAKLMNA